MFPRERPGWPSAERMLIVLMQKTYICYLLLCQASNDHMTCQYHLAQYTGKYLGQESRHCVHVRCTQTFNIDLISMVYVATSEQRRPHKMIQLQLVGILLACWPQRVKSEVIYCTDKSSKVFLPKILSSKWKVTVKNAR